MAAIFSLKMGENKEKSLQSKLLQTDLLRFYCLSVNYQCTKVKNSKIKRALN